MSLFGYSDKCQVFKICKSPWHGHMAILDIFTVAPLLRSVREEDEYQCVVSTFHGVKFPSFSCDKWNL